jgi:hypothetical protein
MNSIPEWFSGKALGVVDPPCRLTLGHLKRAHIDLICAYESIPCNGSRADVLQHLDELLTSRLAHDHILTPLSGTHSNLDTILYEFVVTFVWHGTTRRECHVRVEFSTDAMSA